MEVCCECKDEVVDPWSCNMCHHKTGKVYCEGCFNCQYDHEIDAIYDCYFDDGILRCLECQRKIIYGRSPMFSNPEKTKYESMWNDIRIRVIHDANQMIITNDGYPPVPDSTIRRILTKNGCEKVAKIKGQPDKARVNDRWTCTIPNNMEQSVIELCLAPNDRCDCGKLLYEGYSRNHRRKYVGCVDYKSGNGCGYFCFKPLDK